jgi:hypothetical protein
LGGVIGRQRSIGIGWKGPCQLEECILSGNDVLLLDEAALFPLSFLGMITVLIAAPSPGTDCRASMLFGQLENMFGPFKFPAMKFPAIKFPKMDMSKAGAEEDMTATTTHCVNNVCNSKVITTRRARAAHGFSDLFFRTCRHFE